MAEKRNTYFQDEIVKEKFNMKQLVRVLTYVIPYKKVFILIACLMLLSVGISLIPPLLIKQIVDVVSINKDYKQLIVVLVCLATVGAFDIIITFFHQRYMAKTGHKIIANIRRDIFLKLQILSFDYFDNRPVGKIVVRVTSYINDLANFFANILLSFIINILRIVVVTVFMFALNVQLTLVVLAAILPLATGVFIIRYFLKKLFRYQRAKDSNRTAFIVESIMGINVIKSFNRTDKSIKIYDEIQTSCTDSWKKIVTVNELNLPVIESFWNLGVVTLYGVSIGLISSGQLQAGTVVAFLSYMSMFNGPLTQMATILQQMAQVSSNLERIFETMDTPVEINDGNDALSPENVKGIIDFENVTFAYEEGVNILQDFNLHINQGQKIALVGPTGAGKTTIINLLTRFYDTTSGSVKLDGIDIKDIKQNYLRKNVGVLMQETFIFKGSVIDNIRYGNTNATNEECIRAAEQIHASDFIEKLENGYNTQLAERGDGLSSGEKQLISFARIVLKNPAVIILDEATSSIDTETEEKIQNALNYLLYGRTAIIVAHRLSTIKKTDKILFISNKGISEQGNHEELIEKHGLYYKLCQNH
jgi:ATP-binding cassette subfamily B protein